MKQDRAIRTAKDLVAAGLLAEDRLGEAEAVARQYAIAVTPTVELDLSVSVDGAEPYAVTHRQTISRIAIPSFQPGATVPVRVDPADRTSLMIG